MNTDVVQVIIDLAAKHGYVFTAEELLMEIETRQTLSDQQLEVVSGDNNLDDKVLKFLVEKVILSPLNTLQIRNFNYL